MKKMLQMAMMAAAMFAVVSTTAKAQGGAGRGNRPNPAISILKDSLKVSDAIVAKADSIVKAYADLNAPLMEAANCEVYTTGWFSCISTTTQCLI